MARRRGHTDEQTLATLRQAESGTTVTTICRDVGISDADVLHLEAEIRQTRSE